MKPLPKEFQFKCDKHSLEQCKKLGIDKGNYQGRGNGLYYVKDNVIEFWDYDYRREEIPLISLADYLEHNVEANEMIDHSDLIVDLTGKYVACMATDLNVHSFELDSALVKKAIDLAKETVKQLKERGYLK